MPTSAPLRLLVTAIVISTLGLSGCRGATTPDGKTTSAQIGVEKLEKDGAALPEPGTETAMKEKREGPSTTDEEEPAKDRAQHDGSPTNANANGVDAPSEDVRTRAIVGMVWRKRAGAPVSRDVLGASLYLQRTDVEREGRKGGATTSLAQALQPRTMVAHMAEKSTICDRAHFPYTCEFDLGPQDSPHSPLPPLLLDLTFEDGLETQVALALPSMPLRGLPTISDVSVTTSDDASITWRMTFVDTGASSYRMHSVYHRQGAGDPEETYRLAVLNRSYGELVALAGASDIQGATVAVGPASDGLRVVTIVSPAGAVTLPGPLLHVMVCGSVDRPSGMDGPAMQLEECAYWTEK